MGSSSLKVFSIYQNTKRFITSKRDVNIFKTQPVVWYNKSPEYIIRHCKRIYNELENSNFNYDDLAIYFLHSYIFNDKIVMGDVRDKSINTVKNLYTIDRLEEDQKFILSINEKLRMELKDYFEINTSGGNLIYDELIMKDRLSPYFYIEYENIVELNNKNEEKIELKLFKKIIKKIKEVKKEAKYG